MVTCADLFCGAGGFSEGFRQAGFRVTKALDLWAPAVITHRKNHPDTEVIDADILAFEPARLGPVDVLIGSPPCTEFSFANRGGGGDIAAGMRLVYRFLRFVYALQPKWWVMENVPRTLEFLPAEVPLRELGIDKKGVLEIPVRTVLVSADFGAPQKRARAFSGNFPIPTPTHFEVPVGARARWRTLRDVVEGLPDPHESVPPGSTVTDPVYLFQLSSHLLTDHFSKNLDLAAEEVRENRKAKEDHSWYGRMSFPDELDRPARTIMATQLRVSRETTVIASSSGGIRRLSIREASSVQGFPITYQWWGRSEGLKYKLIGNAVAPPVSFAVASAILEASERLVPERPHVVRTVIEPAPQALTGEARSRQVPLERRFREHIPGSRVPGFRVDLDNQGRNPGTNPAWRVGRARPQHLTEWRTVLYRGSGKALRHEVVSLDDALGRLALTVTDQSSEARATRFVSELAEKLPSWVPDASTLQAIRAERLVAEVTPYALIERLAEIVSNHYQSRGQTIVFLRSRKSPDFVPQRIAATLVATAYACELAQQSAVWAAMHRDDAFAPSISAVPTSPRSALAVGLSIGRRFERALRRCGPRSRAQGMVRLEVEQLTIVGA